MVSSRHSLGTFRHLWQAELPLCPWEAAQVLYLVQSQAGKLRQICVPRPGSKRVRQAVNDYHLMQELIEEVSELEWKRLSGKETIIVLRRLIAYSEKVFQLSKDIVTQVSDRREKPRILQRRW